MDLNSGTVLKTWPFKMMQSWSVNWELRQVNIDSSFNQINFKSIVTNIVLNFQLKNYNIIYIFFKRLSNLFIIIFIAHKYYHELYYINSQTYLFHAL